MSANNVSRERRLQQLENARGLAMELNHDAALAAIESLLREFPDDVEGLRLKGNVLEQKALDDYEYSKEKLTRSSDYLLARNCYERILHLDHRNTLALIDLGDHYKNLEAFDKAFSYYEQAVDLLGTGERRLSRMDEIGELLDTCFDLSQKEQMAERAQRLKLACETLLNEK